MRHYYTAEQIREAEAPLLASLPDGVLMRRAAYGLATAIARELILLCGGIAGRRVCAVIGSGDNGGDALWAATFLRRRGAAAAAVLLNPEHTHHKALAAFTAAGGRVVESVSAATDLVIDGVVGISGSGPLRPNAAEVFAAVDEAGIPVVAVDIPSGIDVQTGAADGPHVHAALTVTFGGLKPVHALGRLRTRRAGRHRPGSARRPTYADSTPPTSQRAGRCPGRRTTSTPRVSPACWPGRRRTRAPRCCAPAPPSPRRREWFVTREALHSRCFRTGPK